MTDTQDYKKAYFRQKSAREQAEDLLESKSRELYETNESLRTALEKLKKQKSHLVQQEKLASIGLLAAGVAHEINNPVGFVKSNLQSLVSYLDSLQEFMLAQQKFIAELPKSTKIEMNDAIHNLETLKEKEAVEFIQSDSKASIEEALSGVERVENIIGNLKDFARTESDERLLTNVNDCIENSLNLVWNEIKYRCNVVKNFADIPSIYACPSQLIQIFVNLSINAAQAMTSVGELTISTSFDDDSIFVEFVDDGPGISEENLVKLFDPFFTTKDVGVGTGLGLYVSHGLVKNHFGSIHCENTLNRGAKFILTLPIDARGLNRR